MEIETFCHLCPDTVCHRQGMGRIRVIDGERLDDRPIEQPLATPIEECAVYQVKKLTATDKGGETQS